MAVGIQQIHTFAFVDKSEKRARARERRRLALSGKPKDRSRQPSSKWVKSARRGLKRKNNAAETHIERLLKTCGFAFVRERPIEIGEHLFFMDFHVNSIVIDGERIRLNIALEIDGGYHNAPEQAKKDRFKDKALIKSVKVWRIVRMSDKEALVMDAESLYEVLAPCAE